MPTNHYIEMTSLPAGKVPSQTVTESGSDGELTDGSGGSGLLIVNADDWGRTREITDRTLECILCGAVSSASGMVFMEDSERAAAVACERGLDVGLHLNFTTPFSATNSPTRLVAEQQRLGQYLRSHRLAQAIFHPGLVRAFAYSSSVQIEEFTRLYGKAPERVDGHHHMHLCANVLLGGLLPAGTIARRSFSFRSGEKGVGNRMYRSVVDRLLARRHRMTDYFFSLIPLKPTERLQRIFMLARNSAVEVESHPVNADEYEFLAGGEIFRQTEGLRIAHHYDIS
jgi:hypothetical protein